MFFYFIIRLLAKPGLDSAILTCVKVAMYIIYAASEKKHSEFKQNPPLDKGISYQN